MKRLVQRVLMCLSVVAPGIIFPACTAPETVFSGNFVQRDFQGSKMTIDGSEIVQTEGEDLQRDVYRKTGRIYSVSNEKGKEEFKVGWDVTDPNAIRKSRFLAEYEDDVFVGLRELIESGIGASVTNVVYIPEQDEKAPILNL